LRELKNRNAEADMVSILERLGDKLVKNRELDKALHSMNAALGLRDKLSLSNGQAHAWEQRGLIREKLGQPVEALEDLTRALTVKGLERKETDRALDARSRAVAKTIGLDPAVAVETFKRLWKARTQGDTQAETEALHKIGTLYNAANRPAEALAYFDRSTASLLAEKARIHKRMGNMRLFEELNSKALETFKQLDYSRYLQMMREARLHDSLSFQMNEILDR
jgi:tetratricopeptide (TPR) repeat protein